MEAAPKHLASKLTPKALVLLGMPVKQVLKKTAVLERKTDPREHADVIDLGIKVKAVIMQESGMTYREICGKLKEELGKEFKKSTVEKWKHNKRVIEALKIYKETNVMPDRVPHMNSPTCPLEVKVEAVAMMKTGARLKDAREHVKQSTGMDYTLSTIATWKNSKKVQKAMGEIFS